MSGLRIEHTTYGDGGGTDWLYDGERGLGSVTSWANGIISALPTAAGYRVPDRDAGLRLLQQLDAVAACKGDPAAAIAALTGLREAD